MKLASWIGPRTWTVVLALVAFELGLHHLGDYGKWVVQVRSERYGWRILPSQTRWSRDLEARELINSAGFRDREWGPEIAGPDVLRLALVGNSVTYGTGGVEIEDTWGRVLERELGERLESPGDARRARVMNFAVQGYAFEQMARVIEDVVLEYRPRILIVPAFPQDIRPMPPPRGDPDYFGREWIARTAIHDFAHRPFVRKTFPPPPTPLAELGGVPYDQLELFIKQRPFAEECHPFWEATGQRMSEVRALATAAGARLAIVAVPRPQELLHPGEEPRAVGFWRSWRESNDATDVLLLDPFPAFQTAMAELVAEIEREGYALDEGKRRFDPTLEHAADNLFADFVHLSPRGHGVLGEFVAEELVRNDWIE